MPYQGSVAPGHITGFAKKHMPNFSTRITTLDQANEFINRRPDVPHKVFLFTSKDETTALFKGLTAEYRDRLEFAEVLHHSKEVCENFEITDFPTLAIFKKNEDGNMEVVTFTEELKFNTIGDWLD
jgi:protein disulfide-isomerase A6